MTSEPTAEPKKAMITSRCACLAVVAVIGLSFSLFGEKGALRLHQVHQQKAALAQQFQQLQESNALLTAEIEALQHDDRYMERVARSRLSLVREGELVYQFSPKSD